MDTSLVIIVLLSFSHVAFAGYPSFLCPASEENNQTFFPCSDDCIYQHGAADGMCGPPGRGDFNCYCGRFQGARVEKSLHCIAPLGKFRELCVVDCQCNHGARTGVCDFDRRACKCLGHDPYNTQCQFPTVAEFADFTAGIVPADSPAWGYLQYFVERPKKCDANKAPANTTPAEPAEATTTLEFEPQTGEIASGEAGSAKIRRHYKQSGGVDPSPDDYSVEAGRISPAESEERK